MKNLISDYVAAVLFVCIPIGLFLFGFGEKQVILTSYSTEFETYVLAEFSETETYIDVDGNLQTDTDYWDEKVSDTWQVHTVNDKVVDFNCPKNSLYKYTCKTPPRGFFDMPNDGSFDGFKEVRKIKYYLHFNDGNYSKVNSKKFENSKQKLNQSIKVSTWYGQTL